MSTRIKILQALVFVVLLADLAVAVFPPAGLVGVQAGPAQWVTSAAQGPALGQAGPGEQDDAVNWVGDFFGGGEENAVNWSPELWRRLYFK